MTTLIETFCSHPLCPANHPMPDKGHGPIKEKALVDLGFEKIKEHEWSLALETPSAYPTRVNVLATGKDKALITLPQQPTH